MGEAGQHHHLGVGTGLADETSGLHTPLIHGLCPWAQGQHQVHQNHVGHVLGHPLYSALSITGLAHDGYLRVGAQEVAQALAHHVVVIHDEDGDPFDIELCL